jgi:hypothetical protein
MLPHPGSDRYVLASMTDGPGEHFALVEIDELIRPVNQWIRATPAEIGMIPNGNVCWGPTPNHPTNSDYDFILEYNPAIRQVRITMGMEARGGPESVNKWHLCAVMTNFRPLTPIHQAFANPFTSTDYQREHLITPSGGIWIKMEEENSTSVVTLGYIY